MVTKNKKTQKKDKKNLDVLDTNNEIINVEKTPKVKKEKTPKVKKEKTPKVKKEKTPKVKKEKTPKVKKEKTPKVKKEKTPQHALNALAKFFGSIKPKHVEDVLIDLLTEKEIKEFSERIEILRQLKKGVTQRQIAKNLAISVTTVSRGSKVLQTGKKTIAKYL